MTVQSSAGRICLVTGATSGLGLVTARGLAAQGARVIVVGRDAARSRLTAAHISEDTGNGSVESLTADFSSQADVRRLADDVMRRHGRLDVLVNNAGAVFAKRRLSPDGLEMTLAVNHLAAFLLTNLLRDLLLASAPARIVNVTSVAHAQASLDLEDLRGDRGYRPFRAYGRSKLANVLFTYELARRLDGSRVTVNAVHPGLVHTRLGAKAGPLGRLVWWGVHKRFRHVSVTPEAGARTILFLADSPDVEEVSGRYFVDCRPVPSSPASYDLTAAARLWEVSADLTGLRDPIGRGSAT